METLGGAYALAAPPVHKPKLQPRGKTYKSCGRSHAEPRSECRFFKATCHTCGDMGYIRPACQASEEKCKAYEKKNKTSGNKAQSFEIPQVADLEKVCQVSPASESKVSPYLSCMLFQVAGQPKRKVLTIQCVLDSGATVTIVHSRFVRMCRIAHNNKPIMCSGAEGSFLQRVGSVKVSAFCQLLGKTITTTIIDHDCLLGLLDLQKLKLPSLLWSAPKARPFLANAAQVEQQEDADVCTTLLSEFPDFIKDSLNDSPMVGPHMELEFDSTMAVIPKRLNYVKTNSTPLAENG